MSAQILWIVERPLSGWYALNSSPQRRLSAVVLSRNQSHLDWNAAELLDLAVRFSFWLHTVGGRPELMIQHTFSIDASESANLAVAAAHGDRAPSAPPQLLETEPAPHANYSQSHAHPFGTPSGRPPPNEAHATSSSSQRLLPAPTRGSRSPSFAGVWSDSNFEPTIWNLAERSASSSTTPLASHPATPPGFTSSFDPWTPELLPPPHPNVYPLPPPTTQTSRATAEMSHAPSEIKAIWTRTADEERLAQQQREALLRQPRESDEYRRLSRAINRISLNGPLPGRIADTDPTSAPVRDATESSGFNLAHLPAFPPSPWAPTPPFRTSPTVTPFGRPSPSASRPALYPASHSSSNARPFASQPPALDHARTYPPPHAPNHFRTRLNHHSITPLISRQHSAPPPTQTPTPPPTRLLAEAQPFHPQSPPDPSTLSSSKSPSGSTGSKASIRSQQDRTVLRSGLPASPARSPHSIWVGNVPADATTEELWRFFGGSENVVAGVESVHLISRSNCAFINYISDEHLQAALSSSNGVSLRPLDKRCKPLLCRVRHQADDAKSGVGAQRGGGLHREYSRQLGRTPASAPDSCEGDEEGSDAGSASTTSSLFAEWFPTRYFILKAHNNEDLLESVKNGEWRTQTHNEEVLDQAYRNSADGVFIVFSANKSGNWFGYARMVGPISSEAPDEPGPNADGDTLGRPFKISWQCTNTLPFARTRSICNSFNAGREVKISRDGTEIEPEAGAQLLEEFWRETAPTGTRRPARGWRS